MGCVDRLQSLSPAAAIAVLLAGLILLWFSMVVEVKIVFISPNLGDVTAVVRGSIQLAAGLVTLAMGWRAFVYRRTDATSRPSSRGLRIENVERVYLGRRRDDASDRSGDARPDDDGDEATGVAPSENSQATDNSSEEPHSNRAE